MMKKYLILILVVILAIGLIGISCKSGSKTTPTAPTPTPGPKVIDNFTSASNANNMGGYWFTVDDCADGGASIISPTAGSEGGTFFKVPVTDEPNGQAFAAHLTGTVIGYNTNTKLGYEYGFLEMATQFSALAGATTLTTGCSPTDISMYNGVQFYAKIGPYDTSGGAYKVEIAYTQDGASGLECPTPGVIPNDGGGEENPPTCTQPQSACQCTSLDSNGDYCYTLPTLTGTWVLVTAPFSQWTPPSWAASKNPAPPSTITPVLKTAKQIAWQTLNNPSPTTGNPPGSFNVELYIGGLELY